VYGGSVELELAEEVVAGTELDDTDVSGGTVVEFCEVHGGRLDDEFAEVGGGTVELVLCDGYGGG